jgi:hypothetical protein
MRRVLRGSDPSHAVTRDAAGAARQTRLKRTVRQVLCGSGAAAGRLDPDALMRLQARL